MRVYTGIRNKVAFSVKMEIKLLSCPLCLKPHFKGVDALRSSLINVATTHLSCPVCSELLLGLDKLTIHLFSHITSNITVASLNTCAPNEGNSNFVVTGNENSYTIKNDNICSQQTVNVKPLTQEKGCVRCDICNFWLSDEAVLDMHQKLLHQTPVVKQIGNYNYSCHLCSKKFKMRGSLMVHLRVAHYGFTHKKHDHNNENNAEIPSYTNETQIQVNDSDNCKIANTKTRIQENKQWECDVCSKMFTTKYFLKKHKRLHTGEMPYYCAQCNKSFTFQQSYHKHMLYHSTEKPHVCSECGRAFKELSTLHNHERIHSGERPFKCETCEKCFRQRVSYLVHRRIHTGVMPYKCTACDKSFRYKVSQRSHKCPANPPGAVVRAPDLVQKLINKQTANINDQNLSNEQALNMLNPVLDTNNENVPHFSINISTVGADDDLYQTKSDKNYIINIVDDKTIETEHNDYENAAPDFFSMVLSPALPDVQSLCLSNSSCDGEKIKAVDYPSKNHEVFETINEESLKELLYGPTK